MNKLQKTVTAVKSWFSSNTPSISTRSSAKEWKDWFMRLGEGYGYDDYTSEVLIKESYGENPYFFMVIDRIADIAANLPTDLIDTRTGKPYSNTINGDATELKKLLENPNKYQNQYEFYYECITNMLLGEVYIYKEDVGLGLPASLYVLTSSQVTINQNEVGLVESYSFTLFNQAFDETPDKVLHLKRPNVMKDTHYGLPTSTPTKPIWATLNQIFKNAFNLQKNQGIRGILFGKGGKVLISDEKEALEKQYGETHGNPVNFNKVGIASTEVGYIQMGVNPSDLKSVEMDLALLRAVCAIFKVSSQLFGDSAASTFSNLEEAKRGMYEDAIMPIVRRFFKSLNFWLIGYKNYCYKVNEKEISILQEDKTATYQNAAMLYEKGLITLQEARERIDSDMKTVPPELLQNQTEESNVTTENNQNNTENEDE